jgi:flagellar basal-body rod protein FlgB
LLVYTTILEIGDLSMDRNFGILHKILQTTGARQKVLASNVANAETPGYKAKDIKFGKLLGKQMKLITTKPEHVGNNDNNGVNGKIVVKNNPSWGDRNNVELNSEVAKMQENSLTHNAAIKILSTKIKMFKTAVSSGR